jgi:arylformamidase
LIDISIPLGAQTVPWPGDQPFHCGWSCEIARGDSVNLATITSSFHVGTHADAPFHVHAAWPTSEALVPSAFIGEAVVIDLPAALRAVEELSITMMEPLVAEAFAPRLLLRTGTTVASGTFPEDWPALAPETADWLVARGVVLWGVDAPSVDRRQSKELLVHRALLGRGAFVLENLDLRRAQRGRYELIAPPVAVTGADAAPVRALLRAL